LKEKFDLDGRLVKVSVFMRNFIYFIYLSAQPILLDITVNVLARGWGLKGGGGGRGLPYRGTGVLIVPQSILKSSFGSS